MTTKETLTPNQIEAVRLLGVYTAGRFDAYILSGSAKASCRAHVMGTLVGAKVPQSKAGVTVLRERMWALAGVPETCHATKDTNFYNWAKEIVKGVA